MKIKHLKIKYLKDAPLGKTGDVAEVPNMDAIVLIRLGIAEKYTPPKQRKKKTDDDSEK